MRSAITSRGQRQLQGLLTLLGSPRMAVLLGGR